MLVLEAGDVEFATGDGSKEFEVFSREDAHNTGMVPAFGDDLCDTVLFAVVVFADEDNGGIVLLGDGSDPFMDFFGDWLGEVGEVENADFPLVEQRSHTGGMSDRIERPLQNQSIEAGDGAAD